MLSDIKIISRARALTGFALTLLALVGPPPATATAAPVAETKRLVVLGDSLGAGFGLDPAEAFPALLQKKIDAANLAYSVVNASVSGDTTAGGARRIDWVLKRPASVLLIELGGNDGLRGIAPEQTRTNLQTIIDRTLAKDPGTKIVIAGMRMPANLGADYVSRFEKTFTELAVRNGAALIPFLLEGVSGRADLNQPDRIHPTADGHKVIAENVWRILLPLLEKADAPALTVADPVKP